SQARASFLLASCFHSSSSSSASSSGWISAYGLPWCVTTIGSFFFLARARYSDNPFLTSATLAKRIGTLLAFIARSIARFWRMSSSNSQRLFPSRQDLSRTEFFSGDQFRSMGSLLFKHHARDLIPIGRNAGYLVDPGFQTSDGIQY